MQQQLSVGNWPRAEPGRLGEAKQNGPSGLLDGNPCRKALASGNIARLPMRASTKQLSAGRTFPAPLLIRYCGAEVSEYFLPLIWPSPSLKHFTVQLPFQLTFSARR